MPLALGVYGGGRRLPSLGAIHDRRALERQQWSIQPTPNLPGIYDLDAEAVSCPTSFLCTAVGGYTNDDVKPTLAERWHGSG